MATIAVAVVFLGVLLTWLASGMGKARSICCNCNLKQIAVAFRLWESDHTNHYPMSVSTDFDGAQESLVNGEVFRVFQTMSNELNTPVVLVCPSDKRRAAKDFGSAFANTNLSYFVGLDADETYPAMFLSGDRNLTRNGAELPSGTHWLSTNDIIGWSGAMHKNRGNVALTDGSVSTYTAPALRACLSDSGVIINRLAIP